MNRRIHGILSLLILCAAVLAATLAIVLSSFLWAVLYIVGILLSCLVLIYSFCMKCPCRKTDCGHVIPGKLTRLFPPRQEGPYTFADKTGVVVPIVFMIVYPQYWLLAQPFYFYLFAILCLIAAADIQFFVCKGCTNNLCPFYQDGCEKK
jgi:MFS family permease